MGGHTGQGSVIAVIDTGVFVGNPELAGRISPDSIDIFSSRGVLNAEDDHGTFVSMTAAAANNGAGTVGIAYGATILAIRADEPGTCAGADGCNFGDMTAAIDYAIDHDATVINMSLGGASATQSEIDAIQRASNAGIIVIVAAGNDGTARPDPFPRSITGAGFENVIIAGSVDSSGIISDFSNRARGRESYFLAAVGEDVTGYLDGNYWLISGTSFSAPQIAGAVALLAEAFPTLTADEIVDLLFETAQDVGVAGVDEVYGWGIMDIHEAFQPQGTTTLAGKTLATLPLSDTSAVGSPAMGDALGNAALSAVVLDKYRRAFTANIGASMRGASLSNRLYEAVGAQTRSFSAGSEKASVALTIDAQRRSFGVGAATPLELTMGQAEGAKLLAARIAMKVAPQTKLGFAYAEGSDGLVLQLQGKDRPAFLIAREGESDDGTFRRSDLSFALRQQLGGLGLTVSATSASAVSANRIQLESDPFADRKSDRVTHVGLAFDRDWGAIDGTLGFDWMDEERTVLGGRFHDAFGGRGSNTMFVDAAFGWQLASDFRLGLAMRNGWTFAQTSDVIESGTLYSTAWSVDLEKRGLFGANDRIGFRVAQPLRVERGGLNLNLPVAYSYETETATFGSLPLSLAPDGREIMGELAWHGSLWGGGASASLYFRSEPGHYATLPDDKGVAVRWRKEF